MTPKQADKIIANGHFITVRDAVTKETFTRVFVSRDRRTILTDLNEKFHRADLEIVSKS